MATYGEYKIISDRSAADLQNTISKSVTGNIAKIKATQERVQKEGRMYDIRKRKRNKEISTDVAEFEKKGKSIANGINDSFNKEYNTLLTEYSEYTDILEDPNSNRKSRRSAMEQLATLDRDILAAKANQETYIGGTAIMEEKLSNSAAMGSDYGFVNLSMGDNKTNTDGGVAQDIANQLIGKPGKNDEFIRNPDGSIEATGMYLDANNNKVPYITKLTPEQANDFLNNPTYNYIKPTENAVKNLEGTFLTKNGALVEDFMRDRTNQVIKIREVEGDGRSFERRETRTVVTGVAEEIAGQAEAQYNAFMANENSMAQVQALETIGLTEAALDLLQDEGKSISFKKLFIERITEQIDKGIINTNPKSGKGLFKDENGWYFVEQVSKTEITKGVSDEFNSEK